MEVRPVRRGFNIFTFVLNAKDLGLWFIVFKKIKLQNIVQIFVVLVVFTGIYWHVFIIDFYTYSKSDIMHCIIYYFHLQTISTH